MSQVWPGAEISDSSTFSHWFGIFAFYMTALMVLVLCVMVVLAYGWLGRKLWRVRYRGKGWWD
jgi:hypothetical protein